ncbi:SUKH-4 family immunity protein [Streptomyces sp. NPDC048590]|uniref:SUKH-4 family immunity protein n=1 Tax=Streptomyces sp. NPDC048590 TaxID=3365574 RepID=UPI00371405F4
MLFDVTRGELAGLFGEHRLATLPDTAFPPYAAQTEGARLLREVGVPTGTLGLREPGGALPLVRDVVRVVEFGHVGEEAGLWPVIGWLLNAHLALDPASGAVHVFDTDAVSACALHTDVSSLVEVAFRFQRLLDEFTFGIDDADEEAGFERLEEEVGRIRRETSAIDPLPFRDDDTVWAVVGDEIAEGRRFLADSPGGRSLYG